MLGQFAAISPHLDLEGCTTQVGGSRHLRWMTDAASAAVGLEEN
jgi:hypothetical protein